MVKNTKKPNISAVYVVRNEDKYLGYSVASIIDYVDEVIIVDNGSTDETLELIEALGRNFDSEKIKVFHYQYTPQLDMGKLRTFALNQVSEGMDWFWMIDADEVYTKDACEKIIKNIQEAPEEIISFRVGYYQVCMNGEFEEGEFEHFPDKLFRVGCGWYFDGVLPVDMMKVGKGYYKYRPIVSYDNAEDVSFENPIQPILKDVKFYHYSRVKTYNQEFVKWSTYCTNIHFDETGVVDTEKGKVKARHIKWVNNSYPIKRLNSQPEIFDEYDFSKFDSYQPLVSVVITHYNYNDFLEDCIHSVIESTYTRTEIIVIDDESDTPPDDIMKKFPQVKYIKKKNGGPADALNVGVRECVGDYFISLDADDILDPEFIEQAVSETKKYPGKMVFYGNLKTFGNKEQVWDYGHYNIDDVDKPKKSTDPVPQSAMVDRRLFDRVDGYDTRPHYFYDWDFWAKIYRMLGNVFQYIPILHYFYRLHGPSNISKLEEQRKESEEYMESKLKKIQRIS